MLALKISCKYAPVNNKVSGNLFNIYNSDRHRRHRLQTTLFVLPPSKSYYDQHDKNNRLVKTVNYPLIVQLLQNRLSNLMAVYAFGSQVSGEADHNSDLDLAVLVAGYADPIDLWDISGDLAELVNCEVDLLDFRAASTVMQYQILTKGERLFEVDSSIGSYESSLLSEMTALNEARAGVLADIQKDGSVYGR